MTTTGTCWPLAAAAATLVPLALLAAAIFGHTSAEPALMQVSPCIAFAAGAPVTVPEPATLLFVGVIGLALFSRRRAGRLS